MLPPPSAATPARTKGDDSDLFSPAQSFELGSQGETNMGAKPGELGGGRRVRTENFKILPVFFHLFRLEAEGKRLRLTSLHFLPILPLTIPRTAQDSLGHRAGPTDQSDGRGKELRPTRRSQVQCQRSTKIMDVEWAEISYLGEREMRVCLHVIWRQHLLPW